MKTYVDAAALEDIKRRFPAVEYSGEEAKPAVYISADELIALLKFLRDEMGFTRMENLTSVDYKTYFEMVYHLFAWKTADTCKDSADENLWITVKVKLDHENPEIPSVTSVFSGSEFEEREVYDLMGINITGHPDLRRILLWEGFPGHPLRKDYKQIAPPFVERITRRGH